MADKVLIVDDDISICKLLEKVMHSNELDTETAGSGKEACRCQQSQKRPQGEPAEMMPGKPDQSQDGHFLCPIGSFPHLCLLPKSTSSTGFLV